MQKQICILSENSPLFKVYIVSTPFPITSQIHTGFLPSVFWSLYIQISVPKMLKFESSTLYVGSRIKVDKIRNWGDCLYFDGS